MTHQDYTAEELRERCKGMESLLKRDLGHAVMTGECRDMEKAIRNLDIVGQAFEHLGLQHPEPL